MKPSDKIGLVIPVFNRKQFTRECIQSLQQQTLPVNLIVVVDDGSTDGTAEMLAREFPEVVVLVGNGHLYWTASINLGIRYALALGMDYILTMNNDTKASPDFVEKMRWGAQQKPNSLIGALDIDTATLKPYYGGERIRWWSGTSMFLLDKLKKEQQVGLHEVSLFPGRGLLIPRAVFNKIGLFEEKKLPHYMADYDFTLMAHRNGFPVYCNYEAKLLTYPEEGGDHKIRKRKTLHNYFDHLFSIKGGGNLKNFTIYTFRNWPSNAMASALLLGYARRLAGFWIK